MSVITGQELATYMGETYATYSTRFDKAINTAELMAAAEIGALSFDAGSSEEKLDIKTSRNAIEIKNGLIKEVTALTINDVSVDLDDVESSYWVITYTNGFTRGGLVVATYDHGYANKAAMPKMLAEGILQIGAWVFTKSGEGPHIGHGKTSEHIADWSATYSRENGLSGSVPPAARKLLQQFARPLA